MTRLRIEDSQRVLFWDVVQSAVFASAGFFLLGLVCFLIIGFLRFFGDLLEYLLGGPWNEEAWSAFVNGLGSLAVLAGVLGALWIMYSLLTYFIRVQWIEIGARLAYHQWGSAESLDWSDVEALYFLHSICSPYNNDDCTVNFFLRTEFVVDLRDDKSSSVSVRVLNIDEARTRLIHTLTKNLRTGDA
jgi:hypothetical protein